MKFKAIKVGDLYTATGCLHERRKALKDKETGATKGVIYYPCGKCYTCRKKAAQQWAFRCDIEAQDTYVYNILLTYDDAHMPIGLDGYPTLRRQQLSDALKRFRYYLDKEFKTRVKFFACGEYSPDQKRPHYHVLIFSPVRLEKMTDNLKYNLSWLNGTFDKKTNQRMTHGVLSRIWYYGISNIEPYKGKGDVGAMVSYMATYMSMSIGFDTDFVREEPPFRLVSRGIGSRIEKVFPKVLPNCRSRGEYTYDVPTPHGSITVAYPRYYQRKWMTNDEKLQRTNDWIFFSQVFYADMVNIKDYHTYILEDENYTTRIKNYKRELTNNQKREEWKKYRQRKVHLDRRKSD